MVFTFLSYLVFLLLAASPWVMMTGDAFHLELEKWTKMNRCYNKDKEH